MVIYVRGKEVSLTGFEPRTSDLKSAVLTIRPRRQRPRDLYYSCVSKIISDFVIGGEYWWCYGSDTQRCAALTSGTTYTYFPFSCTFCYTVPLVVRSPRLRILHFEDPPLHGRGSSSFSYWIHSIVYYGICLCILWEQVLVVCMALQSFLVASGRFFLVSFCFRAWKDLCSNVINFIPD